jgi:hypothetical protein
MERKGLGGGGKMYSVRQDSLAVQRVISGRLQQWIHNWLAVCCSLTSSYQAMHEQANSHPCVAKSCTRRDAWEGS